MLPEEIEFLELEVPMAKQCANLHTRAFQGFYLTSLGKPFLEYYYKSCARDPFQISVVAVQRETREVYGFAVGTASPRRSRLQHLKRPIQLVSCLAPALIHRPRLGISLIKRIVDRTQQNDTPAGALLSSIAVAPEAKGTGLAKKLIKAWQETAIRHHARTAYLTTDSHDNDRARRFYEQAGWSETARATTSYGRVMSHYTWAPPARKPKALQIVGGSEYGGASRIIQSIAVATRNDFDVSVLTTEHRLAANLENLGIRTLRFEGIERSISPLADLRTTLRLAQYLTIRPYDVVHAHTFKGGVIGRLAAKWSGTPTIIYTLHNFAYPASSGHFFRMVNYSIEKLLGQFTHETTTVSEPLFVEAISKGVQKANRTHLIANGIEDTDAARDRTLNDSIIKIVYHGRLAREKGLEELVRAFDILAMSDARIELAMYGEGPLRDDLDILTQSLSTSARIAMPGFCEEIATVLASADIVVQPSHREGQSIALIEALRAGACIIASDIPANRHVLEGSLSECLFKCGDTRALTEALATAIASPEIRASRGKLARRRYQDRYTAEIMENRYKSLYQQTL